VHEKVKIWLQALLNSAIDGGELSNSWPRSFTPGAWRIYLCENWTPNPLSSTP